MATKNKSIPTTSLIPTDIRAPGKTWKETYQKGKELHKEQNH